jgi:Transglutaminase-like superfamily
VLVGDRPAVKLPPAAKAEAPKEAEPWVRAGGCVQCTDPGIRAKAAELANGTDDVGAYARRVIKFTTNNPIRPQFMKTLDAKDSLKCGSSCTGRAQLAAALLRARGIPARTVAHLPTWSGPLFCHWLVEYWHPGVGWVWMEPTMDQPQPPPWTAVVVNVANTADEDDAYAWTKLSGVAAGVPRWAARELSGNLRPTFDIEQRVRERIVNEAVPAGRITGTDAELRDLFAAAWRSFGEWSTKPPATDAARFKRLLAAAKSGPTTLTEAVGRP